jgi:hypothetical protein
VQTVFVDPILREEDVVGTLDEKAALRQVEPLLVALLEPAEPRCAMERLGAIPAPSSKPRSASMPADR